MRLPILIAGLLLSPVVAAEPVWSVVDVFYSNVKLEVDGLPGSSRDGGIGARAWVGRAAPFVTLEHQESTLEGTLGSGDYKSVRGGAGYRFVDATAVTAWARAEYAEITLGQGPGAREKGYGLHGGARFGGKLFSGYGELGFLNLDDTKGSEVRFGGSIQPANYGFLFEVRLTNLDPDIGQDFSLFDARLGARWHFF